jgi:hypothetical protein
MMTRSFPSWRRKSKRDSTLVPAEKRNILRCTGFCRFATHFRCRSRPERRWCTVTSIMSCLPRSSGG